MGLIVNHNKLDITHLLIHLRRKRVSVFVINKLQHQNLNTENNIISTWFYSLKCSLRDHAIQYYFQDFN